ncbi:sulfatase-like hydrolase/transferase (plasmid) [Pedobacter sp. BS3]|uniref:sulfatase family protein n=1 Tax=Pedobacter sp. BS3 TaxID=2567937 RepID=UPI0011EFEBCA|nr:sulfatase-like hydrolase/transferase [Pedobacter sp. BS3]TZF86103.1 sulfatase-like hydrolase/transferase [Pedobacter sp. BS3]
MNAVLAVWVMLNPALALAQAAVKSSKPNILLIMTDQQTADAMSCAGNTDLHTPAMDMLAANGVRFVRAYAAQPLCTPSRTSIFSGKMPHETGFTVNASKNDQLPDSLLMMGKIFASAGYKTGYVGKWHLPLPVTKKQQHGFEYIENTGMGDYTDAATPAFCADFIKKNKDNPFLLVASFLNPHDICEWARKDNLKMDLLPAVPDSSFWPKLPANWRKPANEPPVIREQQHSNYRTYPSLNWNESQWRQYRWAYNRLVEKVDNYIAMVLASLKKYQVENNTIVIFTSDHGDGYAEHQWNQKQVLYEESAKVPFIVSKIGVWKSRTDSSLVCNGIDMIPTMCGFAGIAVPKGLNGMNVKTRIDNPESAWRDTLVTETEFADNDKSLGIKGRAVFTSHFKYIVYNKGELREQLFNLAADPGEMNNLAVQKAYTAKLKIFRDYLKQWCRQHHDTFY